jgi:hypothetical protein
VYVGKNSGTGTFTANQYSGLVYTDPFAIFATDVNNDYHNDLIVANHETNKLTVRYNDGSGGFSAKYSYPVGSLPTDVTAADLNGDGYSDLITEDLYVLYNDRDGTFSPATQLNGAGTKVITADVNGDGMLDVITVNSQFNELRVVLNKGMGDFEQPVQYLAGSGAADVAVADLNGDNLLDLAVANRGSSTVSVLMNTGGGVFAAGVNCAVGARPATICAADIDGDGDVDLATGNESYPAPYDVSVLWNNGNGTFGTALTWPIGNNVATDIAAADVTGDGYIDLVLSTTCCNSYVDCLWHSSPIVVVLPNLGNTRKEPYPSAYGNGTRTTTRNPVLKWTNYWFAEGHQVQITNGYTTYTPEEDELTEPQWTTPYLNDGNWTWKAKSKIDGVWSGWCEPQTFEVYTYTPPPSCPVLFTYDGKAFVQENPLLTACEKSNYTEVVTDYYHVNKQPIDKDGHWWFQLREMEDEITYLYDLSLITVDHSPTTKVAVSIKGDVSLYQTVEAPLSAVDHTGVDRLSELAAEDGVLFKSEEPGYLIVTFPYNGYEPPVIGFAAIPKNVCNEPLSDILNKPGGDGQGQEEKPESAYSVEILDPNGNWVAGSVIPYRETRVQEYVTIDPSLLGDGGTVTVRISWENWYAADVLTNLILADEQPVIKSWNTAVHQLTSAQKSNAAWKGFDGQTALQLVKDDVLEIGFVVGDAVAGDKTRDFIIRAVGRYQPDYSVYTHMVPAQFQLYANYPNPFNPSTAINYDLPKATQVTLDVFNILGQHVARLQDGWQEAGRYNVTWDGIDRQGRTVTSGIYFYRLTTPEFTDSRKMILLK